jgi:ribosomal protein L11 methyltransferase
MATNNWIEVRLLVPRTMAEEASLYLTDFSGRGVIIEEQGAPAGGVLIRGFCHPEEFGPWQQEELNRWQARLAEYNLFPLGLELLQVAEEDWAQAWKAHFKPLKVTPRVVVRPPWEDYQAAPGEVVITIHPGMAFGTGRHPSTALCLRALEEIWGQLPEESEPWQVLDVGTGTGILALAAARLGAGVLAIDLDPEAVAAALENVRLNALEDRILVEETPLTSLRRQFVLILANITAPDLLSLAEALAGRLLAGGALILSGFLEEDLPGILSRYLGLGLKEAGRLTEENWVSLILRRI